MPAFQNEAIPTSASRGERRAPCLGTVAATVVVAFFNPFATKLGALNFNALSVEGTKIVMDRPKLAGFRSDGQAYLLTAERALQDIKQPTMVQLRKVDGEIGTAGGEATHLTADAGVYDNLAEHMELSENVRIKNGQLSCYCEAPDSILSPELMEATSESKSKGMTARRYLPIGLRRSTTARS
jgi:hypothetical protein